MTRAELLLGPDAVSAAPGGLDIAIRQPWYRSLPLSSVVDLEVSVDELAVDRDEIVFSLEGEDHRLDDLPALWEKVWFIQDAATVRVPAKTGATARVEVALTLRFPYIIIDGVGPLTRRTVASGEYPLTEAAR